LLLRKFQKVPNPKGTELGKVQGIGAKHNVGRPHNGPKRSNTYIYIYKCWGMRMHLLLPQGKQHKHGGWLAYCSAHEGAGVIQRRDWQQYGLLLASHLQEEDKKRGYGLIGKTTILHIVNSGSRPDISIFFYNTQQTGFASKAGGEPSLCKTRRVARLQWSRAMH
jgi:hypothetical protein